MIRDQFISEIKLKREKVESFDKYPFCLNAVKTLDTLTLHPAVTFIIGENGSGKSTLLEAIATAWGFNPEGGTKNFNFMTRRSHSDLWQYMLLIKGYKRPRDGFFLRAESFFNVATEIERLDEDPYFFAPPIINSYGGRYHHDQSHGEAFLSLLMNRFGGNSLFIFDEPEAALSPNRQMAFLSRVHQLVKEKSQFIIATHSPIIMAYPNSMIYALKKTIELTEYTATEHYIVTKEFLNNRERMLQILLED